MGYSNFMESDSYKYEIVDTLDYDNYSGDGITFSLLTAGQEMLAALDGIREYTDEFDFINRLPSELSLLSDTYEDMIDNFSDMYDAFISDKYPEYYSGKDLLEDKGYNHLVSKSIKGDKVRYKITDLSKKKINHPQCEISTTSGDELEVFKDTDIYNFIETVLYKFNQLENVYYNIYVEIKKIEGEKNSRKGEILDYTNPYKGETVVDVGSGSGVLLDLLEQRFPEANIVGTDISENCLDTLNHKRISECHKWQVLKHNFVESPLDFEADFVIFSSILHEIYSYTEMNGKKYSLDSVRQALQNAKDSLAYGGTIIIRDGVKSKKSEGRMYLKTKKAREAFLQFVDDFKGNVNKIYSVEEYIGDGCYVWAQDINLLREFACTYTWGTESYSVEVKEQFGYFTLTQYKKELKKLGFTIQVAEEYLEPGYEEHLKDELEFTGGWPSTNMIIVASL